MEPIMMLVIATILAAIFLVAFNKQQENKISNNLYTNDVQHLYLLTAAEYKIKALENQEQFNANSNMNRADMPSINCELSQLTTAFEKNDISLHELNTKLDYLLNTFNINNVTAQSYQVV
ncbi:MAG: hypothetical protein AAGC65_08255 [Mucilaginibacter sp.]|uniref:hypothetical protein n=1 Tax=Mucilaginibacter sp. TaxID=1882438 RepID=UPI00319FC4B7